MIPFAKTLAAMVPATTVRLRRDLGQLLRAIKAHALLHRAHRKRNKEGAIRATIDHDYRAVRSLMGDVLAASAEVQISKRIAETIAAVKKTQPTDKNKGASVRAVAQELKLDRTATWRRLGAAEQAGHLVNVEQRRGRPGQYRTLAGQDPAGEEILPTCAALREAVRERRKARSK